MSCTLMASVWGVCVCRLYFIPTSQPGQPFFFFSLSLPLPGTHLCQPTAETWLSSSLPLCWQSICLPHPASHSFPACLSSSFRESCRSSYRLGKLHLGREIKGQSPWFLSLGQGHPGWPNSGLNCQDRWERIESAARAHGGGREGQAWHLASRSSQPSEGSDTAAKNQGPRKHGGGARHGCTEGSCVLTGHWRRCS